MKADFGVVGLGVMGASLAQNVEGRGFRVAVYNRGEATTQEFLAGPGSGRRFVGTHSLPELAAALERPRRILLLVPAGAAVDDVLGTLVPCLEPGDVVVDGGNSHWRDTERRIDAARGIAFVGMGVSGGQVGALRGPSLMPGGDRASYRLLEPIWTRIAAQTDSGPCVTHVGRRSAGHFVKMVHNGIEYGDMQLIAECYDLLRYGLGLEAGRVAEIFAAWNDGELQSYLVEITSKIVAFPDDLGGGAPLVERIRDEAGQKGTGRWTTEAALELGVPVPTLTAAVDARILSGHRTLRHAARAAHATPAGQPPGADLVGAIREALYAAKICSYAQGFDLMRAADAARDYGIDAGEIARIWKAGCIIRARFLDDIRGAFAQRADLPSLLVDPGFARDIGARLAGWRRTVRTAVELGIPVPALAASLAYFDAARRQRLPAALVQAQRDYFGAHTFQRTDRDGTFHADWPQ